MRQGRGRALGLSTSLLTGFSLSLRAQEQESKLADRLLRPDMSLANSAQDKKFTAAGGTSRTRNLRRNPLPPGTRNLKKLSPTRGVFSPASSGPKPFPAPMRQPTPRLTPISSTPTHSSQRTKVHSCALRPTRLEPPTSTNTRISIPSAGRARGRKFSASKTDP
jgi:hypothetical protein